MQGPGCKYGRKVNEKDNGNEKEMRNIDKMAVHRMVMPSASTSSANVTQDATALKILTTQSRGTTGKDCARSSAMAST